MRWISGRHVIYTVLYHGTVQYLEVRKEEKKEEWNKSVRISLPPVTNTETTVNSTVVLLTFEWYPRCSAIILLYGEHVM